MATKLRSDVESNGAAAFHVPAEDPKRGPADVASPRPIYKIAADIKAAWARPYFGAVPYLSALAELTNSSDNVGCDDAKSIILYFLSNATSFRGPAAKSLKTELKRHLK